MAFPTHHFLPCCRQWRQIRLGASYEPVTFEGAGLLVSPVLQYGWSYQSGLVSSTWVMFCLASHCETASPNMNASAPIAAVRGRCIVRSMA